MKQLNENINTIKFQEDTSISTIKPSEFILEPGTSKVDNAIMLAAGYDSRFVPMTYDRPKGLIPIMGDNMVERQIKQLHEKNIYDITIVVGYLKERFNYLIDKYNVKLVYNAEYKTRNNLASLRCVADQLKNTYILSADNWFSENVFNTYELNSWYAAVYDEGKTNEWCLDYDKQNRITNVTIGGYDSFVMYGPAYLTRELSQKIIPILDEYYSFPGKEDYLWEYMIKDYIDSLDIYIKTFDSNIIYEFETLEELRDFDPSYRNSSKNKSIEKISEIFDIKESAIKNMFPLKEGLTNDSFAFTVNNNSYVFRLPGKGTEKIINRVQEKKVYDQINGLDITEKMIYFDENTGIKISKYYQNSRTANPNSLDDMRMVMHLLSELHKKGLRVEHEFDIEGQIQSYNKLCEDANAILFSDFYETKEKMQELITIKKQLNITHILCHGDILPGNVLILENGTGKLIDWEYAGMADPMMDIAMYAIFPYYSREQIDTLINLYFKRQPTNEEILRVYLYVALSGFLWSMWGTYQQSNGDELGDYIMTMYGYAKDYYKIIKTELLGVC